MKNPEESSNKKLEMDPEFEVVYKGKMFEILQWEGKPGVKFEAAARSPGVRIIIECEKDGKPALQMTKELRRETGGWDYRLPGGKVFDTLDEYNEARKNKVDMQKLALKAAAKEAHEEAGSKNGEFKFIEKSRAGASIEWDLYYFSQHNADIGEQALEDGEKGDVETVKLTGKEIYEKLVNREIKEGRSADMLWWWLSQKGYINFSEK